MKYGIAVISLLVCSILFYNSNWFQSFFYNDQFYKRIYDGPFDVTVEKTAIRIPIKYKYDTCYDLAIAIPGAELFNSFKVGNGVLAYRFISQGKVIAKGTTSPPSSRSLGSYNGFSTLSVLVFDLPFPGAGDDLTLELKVVEPFTFLKAYEAKTFCQISPDYDPVSGGCYNEDLGITR